MTASAAGASPATATDDRIGIGYRRGRQPDPRLAALIRGALAGARTVVNAGASAGSYEPMDAEVTAVDPSQVMLDQHPGSRKVLAGAEELPFEDGAFDAAMAVTTVMTVHHWPDLRRGLSELRRVAGRPLPSDAPARPSPNSRRPSWNRSTARTERRPPRPAHLTHPAPPRRSPPPDGKGDHDSHDVVHGVHHVVRCAAPDRTGSDGRIGRR
ncbi:class I SAM-dependent methyltransferase [Streptomyces sp. 769]|uniref:class I SAM-dependent methyltransferase n=1 Tax=Streptomyces sp. 769 TaxID=1262452 RepID=UPI000581F515|nr:methyltransferase type 11 [Streptomyces sp. 769]